MDVVGIITGLGIIAFCTIIAVGYLIYIAVLDIRKGKRWIRRII